MHEFILISTLNDFIFCPYSIYLHNVYMGGDEILTHATPQEKGKAVHEAIEEKKYSTRKNELTGITVFSEELGIIGKIDIYKRDERLLIERKYKLETIYQGQIYQLWAQYFCLTEMGYIVEKICMHAVSTNKTFQINIPNEKDKRELIGFINKFKNFNPAEPIRINLNKCYHCVYCNLCDKTEVENVYT